MMLAAIGLITCDLIAVFVALYVLNRRVQALEERIDEMEFQIIYLETCLFREAVVSEARHQESAWQATEGKSS